MNSRLEQLQPYPFHKLARLLQDTTPDPEKSAIRLSVGPADFMSGVEDLPVQERAF